MKHVPHESIEVECFANWLRIKELKFTHIANERQTSIQRGAKLKRMGVSRGVPDFMIMLSKDRAIDKQSRLIFIEMKRRNGSKVQPEQMDWINALNKISHVVAVVCYGDEQAQKFMNALLKEEPFYL